MHPDDAAQRGLAPTAAAPASRSRVGEVEVAVEVTDEMMPGVVSLPHGWGHDRAGAQLGVAAQHAGVSANDLTDDTLIDAVSGCASVNGVPVTVTGISASEANAARSP